MSAAPYRRNNKGQARQPYRPQQGFTSAPGPVATPAPKQLKIVGDPHLWTTLQKMTDAASGSSCHTRAMQVPGGVLINTRTITHQGPAEALAFIPGVALGAGAQGIKLVPATQPST
jgi:hypothetical protein